MTSTKTKKSRKGYAVSTRNYSAVTEHGARSTWIQREVTPKLCYYDSRLVAVASGVAQNWVFRANDIFDFDVTYTGHQPMFRDQISTLYGQYKVLNCRVEWQAIGTAGTGNGTLSIVTWHSTPPTATSELIEFSRRKPLLLSPYQVARGVKNVSIPNVLGIKRSEYINNPFYNTAIGSSPSQPAYMQLQLANGNINGSAPVDAGCTLQVFVTFTVRFYQVLDPGSS